MSDIPTDMIDLHCHSNISDGALPPREVVRLAHANGCTLLALTDHDHTGGLAEARQEAEALGVRLISGVEISVSWRKRTIHMVGLNFDEQNSRLQNLLAHVRQGRLERFARMAEKLERRGFTGVHEGALALVPNREMASRTHLAQWLIEQGHVRNKQQAFKKYLGDGKPAWVKHEWASLEQAVAAVLDAGGIAVIAHPIRYGLSATAQRNLFTEFKALGGQAIEVHSATTNLNDRLNYARLADQHGFLASAGSDFHRADDFGSGKLGACPPLPERCRPVWQEFCL